MKFKETFPEKSSGIRHRLRGFIFNLISSNRLEAPEKISKNNECPSIKFIEELLKVDKDTETKKIVLNRLRSAQNINNPLDSFMDENLSRENFFALITLANKKFNPKNRTRYSDLGEVSIHLPCNADLGIEVCYDSNLNNSFLLFRGYYPD